MRQGDLMFSTQKCILGWDVDTHTMTLRLPSDRLQAMQQHISPLVQQKCTSVKRWQSHIGILWSTTPALYGESHLFFLLQHALTITINKRIWLNTLLKKVLQEWLDLTKSAHDSPLPLHMLVPQEPHYLAATDASKMDMGGFWTSTSNNTPIETPFP